jgi:hypothetical protein
MHVFLVKFHKHAIIACLKLLSYLHVIFSSVAKDEINNRIQGRSKGYAFRVARFSLLKKWACHGCRL